MTLCTRTPEPICIPPRNSSRSTLKSLLFKTTHIYIFSSVHHLIPFSSTPLAATIFFNQRSTPRAADMMATMPLLTPSEAHAFQSFLEHVDYSDAIAPEWAMYTNGVHDELVEDDESRIRPLNDQLTRATKDLMSLDTNPIKYSESAAADGHIPFDLNVNMTLSLKPSTPNRVDHHFQTFPDFSAMTSPHLQRQPLTVAPSRTTLDSSASSDSHGSSSDLTPPPLTPPSLKRPYPSVADSGDIVGPSSGARARSSSASTSGPVAGPSSLKVTSATVRATPSTVPSAPKKARATAPHQTGPILGAKPSLLTPSQKKANHIQSEQKRRANIRRGYEALCDTVPALREAIRAEEEASAAANAGGRSRSKKKSRGKKGEQAEKIDGRAGPRSENIVLQKTIDHIQDLLSEQMALKDRLFRARSILPRGHEALIPQTGGAQPLWEREWHGGVGLLDDGNADDADSDEEES